MPAYRPLVIDPVVFPELIGEPRFLYRGECFDEMIYREFMAAGELDGLPFVEQFVRQLKADDVFMLEHWIVQVSEGVDEFIKARGDFS